MIKIAHLLGSLNRGGAEILVLDIFNEAKIEGLSLTLIHRKKGALYNEFKKSKHPAIHLKLKNHFDIRYLFYLRSLIKREHINILHAHQFIDVFLGFLASFGLPTKIVFTLHGHGINDGFISRNLRKYSLKKSDLNLYVSNSLMNYYFKNYQFHIKDKHKVCYNGISFNKFKTDQKKPRDSINNKVKMVMVGNFTSVRDQATVCRFLNLLDKNNFDFNFIFVGAKSNSEPLLYDNCIQLSKHLIEKGKVKFLGSRQDVSKILYQQDVFIYSSDHDTFGIAVIEAMYVGLPVFLNDWEVMKEITDNGKYATIYRSKDEGDLFKKFIHFIENRTKYEQKSIIAKKFVEKNYSIKSNIKNLKQIYQSVIKK